jgi:hypothetical protein
LRFKKIDSAGGLEAEAKGFFYIDVGGPLTSEEVRAENLLVVVERAFGYSLSPE